MREAHKILPKVGDSWKLGFSRADRTEVILTDSANAHINKWLSQDTPEDAVMTVTGELIRIDFDKRIVVLRYPPTRQEIECIYLEELEDTMLENRRQMIQVTGQFTLNADGHPIKLTDVTRIEALDLSPITLEEIQWANHRFRFREALKLTPTLDRESQQLLVVEEPQISLHAFSYTREQLIQEIAEQISFMWEEYVKEDESALAKDALRLRQELLNRLEEVQ